MVDRCLSAVPPCPLTQVDETAAHVSEALAEARKKPGQIKVRRYAGAELVLG